MAEIINTLWVWGSMTNEHCDSVPIEEAYKLMERLDIDYKQDFATLCGVSRSQFDRWEKKGRMPLYRLAYLRETLARKAKERYDKFLEKLYAD